MVYWPGVINTANSLVGTSMLAMPFVLSKCGVVLGPLLILFCGLACHLACSAAGDQIIVLQAALFH